MASTAGSKCSGSKVDDADDPALKLGTSDLDMNAGAMRALIAEQKRMLEELQKQAQAWRPGKATRSSDPSVLEAKPAPPPRRPAAQGTTGTSGEDQAIANAMAEALGCDSHKGTGQQLVPADVATSRSHKSEWNRLMRICESADGAGVRGKTKPCPEMVRTWRQGGAARLQLFREWLKKGEDTAALNAMVARKQAGRHHVL